MYFAPATVCRVFAGLLSFAITGTLRVDVTLLAYNVIPQMPEFAKLCVECFPRATIAALWQ
ncbi:MAG: hypothetical protein ACREF9_15415 [Opitutaceae bacterium]